MRFTFSGLVRKTPFSWIKKLSSPSSPWQNFRQSDVRQRSLWGGLQGQRTGSLDGICWPGAFTPYLSRTPPNSDGIQKKGPPKEGSPKRGVLYKLWCLGFSFIWRRVFKRSRPTIGNVLRGKAKKDAKHCQGFPMFGHTHVFCES